MAGDWIKMRANLAGDPAVLFLTRALKLDKFAVIGRLHAFWSWVDQYSADGVMPLCTADDIDALVEKKGFATALVAVKWLILGDDEILVPSFDTHNGESAKKRSLAADRQRDKRDRENAENATTGHASVTPMSRNERDESVTREEKRREEKNKASGSEGAREADSIRRETTRSLPPQLEALGPQFREAWEGWLLDLAERFGRAPTMAQSDSHLSKLLEIHSAGGSPIEAITNAIERRLRVPALPLNRNASATAATPGTKAPSVWELQQKEAAVLDRLRALDDGRGGKEYVADPKPGEYPGWQWTEEGKRQRAALQRDLKQVRDQLAHVEPVTQEA